MATAHGGTGPAKVLRRAIGALPEDILARKVHQDVRVARAIFLGHPSGTRRPSALESTTEATHFLPKLYTLLYVLVARRLYCGGDPGKRDGRRGDAVQPIYVHEPG